MVDASPILYNKLLLMMNSSLTVFTAEDWFDIDLWNARSSIESVLSHEKRQKKDRKNSRMNINVIPFFIMLHNGLVYEKCEYTWPMFRTPPSGKISCWNGSICAKDAWHRRNREKRESIRLIVKIYEYGTMQSVMDDCRSDNLFFWREG